MMGSRLQQLLPQILHAVKYNKAITCKVQYRFLKWLLCADNVELGTACGKLHRVSTLAITDAGEYIRWLWPLM